MDQQWFEMSDIRYRSFNKSTWIPFRACDKNKCSGEYGHEGYKEEFFGVGSIAVPVRKRKFAEKLGWQDIGITRSHAGVYYNEQYFPLRVFIKLCHLSNHLSPSFRRPSK